ncbi:MAG TPA: twin-arginine translocase subunit TatC [Aggregatilineales bacterium]|nr:twin-arginine translocase subunit TatC [Aggregatilineales bacterium]
MASQVVKPPETGVERSPAGQEGQDTKVMSFFEHLEELRNRLFHAVIAIIIGMVIGFALTNPVLNIIKNTYGDLLRVLDPVDSLVVYLRVSLMIGAILASPVITYQILMFIMPGLTKKERRWVLMSLPATTILFLIGLAFTWYLLIPAYITFLKGFQSDVFKVDWTADNYVGFITTVLFWHAAAFETPLVFFILGRLGAVRASQMLKYWRHAVVADSLIAAFIAPTIDPLTMIVITLLLVALYALSVVLVALTSGWKRVPTSAR